MSLGKDNHGDTESTEKHGGRNGRRRFFAALRMTGTR